MRETRTVPKFCLSVKLAPRLKRRGETFEARKLMDVVFDIFFDAKELLRHVKRAEDYKRIVVKESTTH